MDVDVLPYIDRKTAVANAQAHAFIDASTTASFMLDDDDDNAFDRPSVDYDASRLTTYVDRPTAADLRMSSILKLPTMHVRGPVFHGWLWKRGASFKTWKQRFFLLNGCTLTYYTQSCVVDTEFGPKCFELPATGGLRVASAEFTDATSFGIKITSTSGRVLYVQAGDRASRIKWLGVLQQAPKKMTHRRHTSGSDLLSFTQSSALIQSQHSDRSSSSIQSSSASSTLSSGHDDDDTMVQPVMDGVTDMRGWLSLRRRFKGFKQRFITLQDGRVTITSNQRDRRPKDPAYEVISVTTWNGHECGLHVQLNNHKDLYVKAASIEEAKQWKHALQNSL